MSEREKTREEPFTDWDHGLYKLFRNGLVEWGRLGLSSERMAKELVKIGVLVWRRIVNQEPDQKCVIYGQGRSGSTLLKTLLGSHPQLTTKDELLSHRRLFPVQFVEYEASRASTSHFLWHLKPWHPTRRQAVELVPLLRKLEERGYTFIHLRRKNEFLKSLSQVKLFTEDILHAKEEDPVPEAVEINPRMLVSMLREKDRAYRVEQLGLDALEQTPVRVEYETDLQDAARHQPTCDRLFEALGLPPAEVTTMHKKTSPSDWRAGVVNVGEVESALRIAGYEEYLS